MANFKDSLTFENYDQERLIIDSIAARLSAEENAFRKTCGEDEEERGTESFACKVTVENWIGEPWRGGAA